MHLHLYYVNADSTSTTKERQRPEKKQSHLLACLGRSGTESDTEELKALDTKGHLHHSKATCSWRSDRSTSDALPVQVGGQTEGPGYLGSTTHMGDPGQMPASGAWNSTQVSRMGGRMANMCTNIHCPLGCTSRQLDRKQSSQDWTQHSKWDGKHLHVIA